MVAALPLPTELSMSSSKKDSPFIINCQCCSTGSAHVVVVKQGGFADEEDDEGLMSKIGAVFKKLCCCCKSKEEADEPPAEEKHRATRRAVEQRVVNALYIGVPGMPPPPKVEVEAEALRILESVDPQWKEKTRKGAPLRPDEFHSIRQERERHTHAKIERVADALRGQERARAAFKASIKGPQVTPVKQLLLGLILFIHERSGKTHQAEERKKAVRKELQRYGYQFSDFYVEMIIENALHQPPGKHLVASTFSHFESVFQVASEDAGQGLGPVKK